MISRICSTSASAAFTDVDNRSPQKAALLRLDDFHCLDTVRRDKPLFAFLHWGQEYSREPGPREEALIDVLQAKGVELIMGCHTHRASNLIVPAAILSGLFTG